MNYRREIDGLRALAILPVIFFHAGFKIFSSGFVGVDVFFVISGYLITFIILTERQAGTFSLLKFYERRARRILPALFVVMAACLPFAWLWMLPKDLYEFSKSLGYVSLFASNIFFYGQSGYFDSATELKPLLHTWSLAVEEQYYLLFPISFLLIWKLGKQWGAGIILAVMVASFGYAEWGSHFRPEAAFYLLPSRLWELLVGVLVALYLFNDPERKASAITAELASVVGFLLVVCAVFTLDKNTPFPGLYALLPTSGAALIIIFTTPRTWVGRLLGSKALVGIGLISYSAYLWHQPIFAFARHRSLDEPSAMLFLVLSVITFALAYLSWRYVERPFRDRNAIGLSGILSFGLIGAVLFSFVGMVGKSNHGFEDYYVKNRISGKYKEIYLTISKNTGGRKDIEMADNRECKFWTDTITPDFEARFQQCARKYEKAILVVGDSHAMNIYNAFYKADLAKFMVGISKAGCRPHNNYPYCHYDALAAFVKKNGSSIKYVVFHQSGSYFLMDHKGKLDSQDAFVRGKGYKIHLQNIQKDLEYLDQLAPYVEVIWLGPFAEARLDFKDFRRFTKGYEMNDVALEAFDHLENEIKSNFSGYHGRVKYRSLADILQIDKGFLMVGNCLTYRDSNHFSACGEQIVGDRIKNAWFESN